MPSANPWARPPSRYATPSATYLTLNTVRRLGSSVRAIKVETLAVVAGASDFGGSAEEASVLAGASGEAAIDASSGFAEFAATDFVEDVSSGFEIGGCSAFATVVLACDATAAGALATGLAAGGTGLGAGTFAI